MSRVTCHMSRVAYETSDSDRMHTSRPRPLRVVPRVYAVSRAVHVPHSLVISSAPPLSSPLLSSSEPQIASERRFLNSFETFEWNSPTKTNTMPRHTHTAPTTTTTTTVVHHAHINRSMPFITRYLDMLCTNACTCPMTITMYCIPPKIHMYNYT